MMLIDRRTTRDYTPWLAMLGLWLAVLIATPIAGWVAGDATFPTMASLGVVAQASVTLMALAGVWPVARLVRAVLIVVTGTWAVEALGIATGFPFGHYEYTDALQPQAAGVPLLIPLAWLMMLPPAWAAAGALVPNVSDWRGRIAFAMLSGLAFTAWDLYLDPQMVERKLWVWNQGGAYFGIPLVNFVGWWTTATLLTLLIGPDQLPRLPLLAIYTLTWAFQAVGLGVFWGQPGPALAGFAGMGVLVWLAWRKERS
ncbi:MAG: carotenoid biosynthesis protein [Chloroflexi bacterium]|nr:carotenoid biosynthesis protein [Chloroflexota bacterium]